MDQIAFHVDGDNTMYVLNVPEHIDRDNIEKLRGDFECLLKSAALKAEERGREQTRRQLQEAVRQIKGILNF